MYYLPGVPEAFYKTFQLQVAFFEPETISIRGEGIFPRVCLDLPRDLGKCVINHAPVLQRATAADLLTSAINQRGVCRSVRRARDGQSRKSQSFLVLRPVVESIRRVNGPLYR